MCWLRVPRIIKICASATLSTENPCPMLAKSKKKRFGSGFKKQMPCVSIRTPGVSGLGRAHVFVIDLQSGLSHSSSKRAKSEVVAIAGQLVEVMA